MTLAEVPSQAGTLSIHLTVTGPDGPLDYNDAYLDIIWTPIVGATAIQAMRNALHITRSDGGQTQISNAELAKAVGCSPRRINHALERLHQHQLVKYRTGQLQLRTGIETAPQNRIRDLTERAQTYAANRHSTIRRTR